MRVSEGHRLPIVLWLTIIDIAWFSSEGNEASEQHLDRGSVAVGGLR
jgi:hypothetical protein